MCIYVCTHTNRYYHDVFFLQADPSAPIPEGAAMLRVMNPAVNMDCRPDCRPIGMPKRPQQQEKNSQGWENRKHKGNTAQEWNWKASSSWHAGDEAAYASDKSDDTAPVGADPAIVPATIPGDATPQSPVRCPVDSLSSSRSQTARLRSPTPPRYVGAFPKSSAISSAQRPGPNQDWSDWQRQLMTQRRAQQHYQETQRNLLQRFERPDVLNEQQQQHGAHQHHMQQHYMQQHLYQASSWQHGQYQQWPGYQQSQPLVYVVPHDQVTQELQAALNRHGWLAPAQ